MKIRIIYRLKISDQIAEMAVALAVDIFIFFQHLIKIQGPVHGKLNIPFEEIFHRQMERIHHLVKHLIGIVCKIHKISAFQTVILLLAAVTVKNIQEFLAGRSSVAISRFRSPLLIDTPTDIFIFFVTLRFEKRLVH